MPITWLSLFQSRSSTSSLSVWGIPIGITQMRSREDLDMLHTFEGRNKGEYNKSIPNQLLTIGKGYTERVPSMQKGDRHERVAAINFSLV